LLLVGAGALLEGPVVTIAAAALAGAGHLPWWGVWIAATLADIVATPSC
jgi:membrane protein DedA with SNARE-associated domain